jgi:hypothetical protein
MTSAALDLQQSIFKILLADSELGTELNGQKIYDQVPDRVKPPYVVVGRTTADDWSTSTENGEAVTVFIHVWSDSGSRRQCHVLQTHLKRLLHDQPQSLENHHLVALRLQFSETRRDLRSGHLHGVMRFRGVTETAF